MQHYENMVFETYTLLHAASLDERAKYAPRSVVMIDTHTKLGILPAARSRNKRKYWLYLCRVCKEIGIIRSDRIGGIKCKHCNKRHKVEHEPRTDHSNTFHGDFTVLRQATLQDRRVFAPRTITAHKYPGGYVKLRSAVKCRNSYWLYRCDRCDAYGVCRIDKLKTLKCKSCGK